MELFTSENANLNFLASTSRQDACATYILVALCRVDIELYDHLKAFFELALLRDTLRRFEDFSSLILAFHVDLCGTFSRLIALLRVETLQGYMTRER